MVIKEKQPCNPALDTFISTEPLNKVSGTVHELHVLEKVKLIMQRGTSVPTYSDQLFISDSEIWNSVLLCNKASSGVCGR